MKINETVVSVTADPQMPLLWVLRDLMNLTGTKYGCGIGACGACTVLVNGAPTRSCSIELGDVVDAEITTIEGMTDATAEIVKSAWKDMNAFQCGYCQSGQIVTAIALLRENPEPSDYEIDAAMSPLLCRCGTYPRIKAAIRSTTEKT